MCKNFPIRACVQNDISKKLFLFKSLIRWIVFIINFLTIQNIIIQHNFFQKNRNFYYYSYMSEVLNYTPKRVMLPFKYICIMISNSFNQILVIITWFFFFFCGCFVIIFIILCVKNLNNSFYYDYYSTLGMSYDGGNWKK